MVQMHRQDLLAMLVFEPYDREEISADMTRPVSQEHGSNSVRHILYEIGRKSQPLCCRTTYHAIRERSGVSQDDDR